MESIIESEIVRYTNIAIGHIINNDLLSERMIVYNENKCSNCGVAALHNYIGQVVQLIYIDRKRQVSIRQVKVLSIKGERMKAYCYTAKAFRIFSLANIIDVELIGHVG